MRLRTWPAAIALILVACSGADDSPEVSGPGTIVTDETSSATSEASDDSTPAPTDPADTAPSSVAATTTTTTLPPLESIQTPAVFRRATPGARLAGVVAAEGELPRLAVGTSTEVDGTRTAATWTWAGDVVQPPRPLPGSGFPVDAGVTAGGLTYVIGESQNGIGTAIWTSTDRVEWTFAKFPQELRRPTELIEAGGSLVGIRRSTDGIVATSYDSGAATDFSNVTSQSGDVDSVAINGGTVVVISRVGDFVSVDGGITWGPVTIGADSGDDWSTSSVQAVDDGFVATGQDGRPDGTAGFAAWFSADGRTWSREDVGFAIAFRFSRTGFTTGSQGRILASFGDRDNTVAIRDAGGTWSTMSLGAEPGLTPELAQAAIGSADVVFARLTEPSSRRPARVAQLVDGQLVGPVDIAPDEGSDSFVRLLRADDEVNFVVERFVPPRVGGGSPEAGIEPYLRLTATSTDLADWVVTEEPVPPGGPTDGSFASDGTTIVRVNFDLTVDARTAGETEWRRLDLRANSVAVTNGIWLFTSPNNTSFTSTDLDEFVPISLDLRSGVCVLPDGRLVVETRDPKSNTTVWFVTDVARTAANAVDLSIVPTGCISLSSGVLFTVDGDDPQFTVDLSFFLPQPTAPSLASAKTDLGRTAGAGVASLWVTTDDVTWTRYPFDPGWRLLDFTAIDGGYVLAVDDGAGLSLKKLSL